MPTRPFDTIADALHAWESGDAARAEDLFREGLEAYRQLEPKGLDFALGRCAAFLIEQGRPQEARPLLEEAVGRRTDIPAIWHDYLRLLAELRDLATLLEGANGMRAALGYGPEVAQLLLALARRADKSRDATFAEAVARSVLDDASDRGDRRSRWAAVGDLGHILERGERVDEAMRLWREAFAEGSDDPVTVNRLTMHLERAKECEEAIRLIELGLDRALPANVEEQLRKRLERCRAKLQGGRRARTEVAAYSVRAGEGVLAPLFQVRLKPPLRDLEIVGSVARCLGVSKGVGTLVDIQIPTGEQVRRVEALPAMGDTWFQGDGWGIGISRMGRIGDGYTELWFMNPEGRIIGQGRLPDATSEVAGGPGLWYVGCRDGLLYGFGLDGERLWAWETPGSRGYEDSPYFRPCPYYVNSGRQFAAVSSMGDVYAVSPQGRTLWHTRLPNEEQTAYTFSVPLGDLDRSARAAYRTLGLSPGASHDEVKGAYRKLALDTHPDRNPQDSEAAERFIAVQAAYEGIVSGASADRSSGGLGPTIEVSVQITGMEPLVSSLHANDACVVVGTSQGRLYLLDRSGRMGQVRALGRGRVDAVLGEDGSLAAAWCDGALFFFHDAVVVNAAGLQEPPRGMQLFGDGLVHWRRNRVDLMDRLGRTLWVAEFSKGVAGLATMADVMVCGAGVLAGFERAGSHPS